MISVFTLSGLAAAAYGEFSDAGDYFWKASKFIQSELREEYSKLSIEYPLEPNWQEKLLASQSLLRRWAVEIPKINSVFTYLIYSGNLFTAASMLEKYLLLACKQIETSGSKIRLFTHKGNGIERYYSFMRASGVSPESIKLYSETDALIRLRNCIYHASGLLEMSREARLIERIVEKQLYFESVNQAGTKRREHDPLAIIIDSKIGKQVRLAELMGWYSAHVFRDFFCALYMKAYSEGVIVEQEI
jgi:hypothetical protein